MGRGAEGRVATNEQESVRGAPLHLPSTALQSGQLTPLEIKGARLRRLNGTHGALPLKANLRHTITRRIRSAGGWAGIGGLAGWRTCVDWWFRTTFRVIE